MRCPNCNTKNKDSSLLCDTCGFPLDKVSSSSSRQSNKNQGTTAASSKKSGDALHDKFEKKPQEPCAKKNNPFGDPTEGLQEFSSSFNPSAPNVPSPISNDNQEESSFKYQYAHYSRAAYQAKQNVDVQMESEEEHTNEEPEDEQGSEIEQQDMQENTSSLDPVKQDNDNPDSTIRMPRVESEPASKSTDFKSSSTVSHSMRINPGLIVGILVVIACAIAVYLFVFGPLSGREVPDVVGMTSANAQTALEKDHFKSKILEVKSDEEEGTVLLSDPSPHSRAPEGSEIVLHIATTRTIPTVVGLPEKEALSLLKQSGYDRIVTVREKSPDEENIILSITPNQGDRAKSNIEITIVVSEAYRVPNVMGMDIEEARNLIAEEGFEPNVIYVDSTEHSPGTILGTTPEIGAKVNEGEMITINVARPRGVELIGLSQSYLAPGSIVNIGGTEYQIDSQGSFSYLGNDAVSYSITGRPRTVLAGEVVFASARTLSGQIQWSPTNQVMSIS